jgi:exodeoxyribonuclease VII large subunit
MGSSALEGGTLTVGQLADGIGAALGTWFTGEIWITGEIDSLRRTNNGHVYFQLVERDDASGPVRASIAVTLLDSARRYVNTQLREAGGGKIIDGMQVRIRGRVEYYAPQGRAQVLMSGIDPSYTLGLLVTERERVLARLSADGLLGRNGALALPPLPLHVGLVTSDGSAAMADFVDELRASGFSWRVTLAHVAVQGRGADIAIARAVERVTAAGVDAVAVVRGGGSRMDLSTFDSEVVGRAIATATAPVLTGVGHEIDISVADAVAHTSSKTPTACAATLVAHVHDTLQRTDATWRAIASRANHRCRDAGAALRADARLLSRLASARLDGSSHRLDACRNRVLRSPMSALDHAERKLGVAEATVRGADPAVLTKRGWSITRTATDAVVRSATQLQPGDQLFTVLADGMVESRVEQVRVDAGSTSDGA